MSFNPIDFVTRDEIPVVIQGRKVTAYALDIDELTKLAKQFEWFEKQMRGEEIDVANIPKEDLLDISTLVVAASLAPDTRGDDRRAVEQSARAIRSPERIDLLNKILTESFERLDADGAEGNGRKPGNRHQRRAVRSKGGGTKPQT